MDILTADRGWVKLIPPTVNESWQCMTWDEKKMEYVPDANGVLRKVGTRPGLPSSAKERGDAYVGEFPSARVCEYVNSLKEKMKFFDDGVRMQYDRPDRTVEVEPSDVKHPIPYPPHGFKLINNQWVYTLKRSKYA